MRAEVVAPHNGIKYFDMFFHGHVEESQPMGQQKHDSDLYHPGLRIWDHLQQLLLATTDSFKSACLVLDDVLAPRPAA